MTAGVPTRIPLVTKGFSGSLGMVFLFTVMPTSSSRCSYSLAGEAKVPGVHQNQMVVRAAGDQPEALLDQLFRQNPGVGSHLPPIGPELRLQRLAQAHGLGGDDMLQRTALCAGEHGGVDLFVQVVVIAQDHAAPGTPAMSCGWWWSPHRRRGWGRDEHRRPPDPQCGPCPPSAGRPLRRRSPGTWQSPGCGDRRWPPPDQLGRHSLGDGHHLLVVDGLCVVRHAIGTMRKYLPEMFTGLPWLRWPPWARFILSTVSPGCSRAKNAARLALAPEWGWTLACAQPNS